MKKKPEKKVMAQVVFAELRKDAHRVYLKHKPVLEKEMGCAIDFETWLLVQLAMHQEWRALSDGD